MNKNLLRALIVAGAIAVLFILQLVVGKPFGKSSSSFSSEPKEEITKIEFSEDGRKLLLEASGDKWLINGDLEARKTAVQYIVRILKDIRIKSPVSPDYFNKEIVEKTIQPVRVRVFEKRKLLRTLFVYKTRGNIYGNIMKIKPSGKPFIVYLPDYEGDIGSGFTTNELFWQPYIVFNLLPSEISSVVFENIADTASSFSLVNRNNHTQILEKTGSDSALVKRYLSYFTHVPFEEWEFSLESDEKKSIESQKPLYRITVTSSEGIKSVLTLWEKLQDSNIADSDRLWGKTQSSDELFILRYFDIDPLIKKRSYFFPK